MDELLVGTSILDITPEMDTPLAGYRRHRPASGLHSSLKVKCLTLQRANKNALIVAVDAFAIPNQTARKVKLKIARDLGIAEDSILIAASHTHSAPDTIGFASQQDRHLAQRYLRTLEDNILEVAKGAQKNRYEARAYTAVGKAFIGFNRVEWSRHQPLYRTLVRTGLIRCANHFSQFIPPILPRNRAQLIGPVDPDLNIIWFVSEEQRGAAIVNYACHPTVLGQRSQIVSGDYPSTLVKRIEESFGDGFVTLFTNGAAGNVNPNTCWGYLCDGTTHDVERLGYALADEALRVMRTKPRPIDPHLEVKRRMVALPRSGQIEIQTFHLSDWVMVGVPGELSVETGLWMKRQVNRHVVVVGFANGYLGYILPKTAFDLRCRETERQWWNLALPGTEERLRSEVMSMIN